MRSPDLFTASNRRVTLTTIVVVCLCGTLTGTATRCDSADERRVFEYKRRSGTSWFVHSGSKKWVVYRADGQTFLYLEQQRTAESIEMRGPHTKLLVRVNADGFDIRRSPDDPWRLSAPGRWVSEENLPEHIRQAPPPYQVRLVYFVPTDREPVPAYAPKIRHIMSIVAELLHDDLRSKGYRPKPLEFESKDGEITVHLVRGTQPASFYIAGPPINAQEQMDRIHDELRSLFGDPERHLYVVFCETYESGPSEEAWVGHIARGGPKPPDGGIAAYSSWILKDEFSVLDPDAQRKLFFDRTPVPGRKAFGSRVPNSPRYEFVEDAFGAAIHELGHALGLPHDYRSPRNIMGQGFRELRWSFARNAPTSRKPGFSVDNARMLMSSRYLAADLNLEDFDPPRVELDLTRRGRTLTATVVAEDNTGLRALLFYDRTKERSSLVGGKALRGTRQKIVETLPADLPTSGLVPKIEVYVSDDGGNVTRVTKSLVSDH